MLYAIVRQRKIEVKSPTYIVRNGVNVDTLTLEMDDEWAGMDSIVGVFTLTYTKMEDAPAKAEGSADAPKKVPVQHTILHMDAITFGQPITVPWEVLVETGVLTLSVTGYVGTAQIMRTAKAQAGWNVVVEGGDNKGEPTPPPTPGLLQQLLDAAKNANDSALSADEAAADARQVAIDIKAAADRGDFDGKPGEKGDTGATGKDGLDGYSPTVTTKPVEGGTEVTVTDANGTHAFTVLNGKDAKDTGGGLWIATQSANMSPKELLNTEEHVAPAPGQRFMMLFAQGNTVDSLRVQFALPEGGYTVPYPVTTAEGSSVAVLGNMVVATAVFDDGQVRLTDIVGSGVTIDDGAIAEDSVWSSKWTSQFVTDQITSRIDRVILLDNGNGTYENIDGVLGRDIVNFAMSGAFYTVYTQGNPNPANDLTIPYLGADEAFNAVFGLDLTQPDGKTKRIRVTIAESTGDVTYEEQIVEDELPTASKDTLGGVKAAPAQAGDTKGVYIDEQGFLHVAPDVLVVQATKEGGVWKADVGSETIRSFGGNVILRAEVDGVAYSYRYQRYDSARGAVFDQPNIQADSIERIEVIVDRDRNVTVVRTPYTPPVQITTAVCHDEAAPQSITPNIWYVSKDLPKPSATVGLIVDVYWEHGRVDDLGYDVKLIWGAPDDPDNELILDQTNTSDPLVGDHSIPVRGTVRYQLVETNGRKHWRYVSGKLLPRQFSSATEAATADKVVPGMQLSYIPGEEIFVQLDNGNTAAVARIVPDEGPTLPIYGNGEGAATGEIPAGYILHLANAGDHWQILNSPGKGGESQTAVLYTPQELTDEQEKQARVNIGIPSYGPEDEGKVLGIVGGKLMWIAGGTPPPEKPVYGNPVTDVNMLKIAPNGSKRIGIKLSPKPNLKQKISISSVSPTLSFNVDHLDFTPDNWDKYQYVTVTAGEFSSNSDATIVLRNSDPLMTDYSIPVKLIVEEFPVDMTIPTEGQHVLTADDFTTTSPYGDAIRLYGYKAPYTNIVIPSKINGQKTWIAPVSSDASSTSFPSSGTKLKYVTFEDGVICRGAGATVGQGGDAIFSEQSELIGVSNFPVDATTLDSTFSNCSSLKFVDNLDKLTKVESMYNAFKDSGIEYIQDLSALKKTTNMDQCFLNCKNLKKIYGLPDGIYPGKQIVLGCSNLTSVVIPAGVTTLFWTFYNCKSLKTVEIYAENVSTVENAFFGCTGVTVYAVAGSKTFDLLNAKYGSSTDVTIVPFGAKALPNVVVWGDSTSSPNRGWKEWPARLIEKIPGYNLKNQAVSGEFTTSTSARQGGNTLSVDAFTIPAGTGATPVVLKSKDGQTFGTTPVFSCGGAYNPCKISDVSGLLSYKGGGQYTFSRYEAGSSVSVAGGSVVVSEADPTFNNSDAIMLVNLGINSGWDDNPDLLLEQVKYMVAYFKAKGGTKYIISGPYAGSHVEGAHDAVLSYESKASAEFGVNWLNLREYLIQNGLSENDLSATPGDTERMANGLVPGSLLGGGSVDNILMFPETSNDSTHPNAYGQSSISLAFYQKGQELGYWA